MRGLHIRTERRVCARVNRGRDDPRWDQRSTEIHRGVDQNRGTCAKGARRRCKSALRNSAADREISRKSGVVICHYPSALPPSRPRGRTSCANGTPGWITQDPTTSKFGCKKWPWSAEQRHETWDKPIPSNMMGLAHSHPDRLSPKPSTGGRKGDPRDDYAARQIQGISRKGIGRLIRLATSHRKKDPIGTKESTTRAARHVSRFPRLGRAIRRRYVRSRGVSKVRCAECAGAGRGRSQ
jgi:hypothetical protein